MYFLKKNRFILQIIKEKGVNLKVKSLFQRTFFALCLGILCGACRSSDVELSDSTGKKDMKKSENTPLVQDSTDADALSFSDSIPSSYFKTPDTPLADGSIIKKIDYNTKDYYGDGGEITKSAHIYLPAGYDGTRQYDVLYLLHGIGGNESEWGMSTLNASASIVKKIMDNLVEEGTIEPFIIVTPNGRSSRHFAETNSDYNSFYKFGEELRNDLIPYIDSHFSTKPDRNYRAVAGLSMGGMQTINIGICECLDLFSYFGAFSAAPTSYQSTRIASYVDSHPEYQVKYFYNLCGLEDGVAYASASNAAKLLARVSGSFEEGRNFTWQEVHGGHDFGVWYLGFYNFARIIFKQN